MVRDLWVLLESELTFARHIDQVCHSCYYQLRHLKVIARSLNFNAVVSVIHAFVFSRLNYCGSIFAGLPRVLMEKLRWVHRATAQLAGKFTRLTTNFSIVIVYVSIYLIYVVGFHPHNTSCTRSCLWCGIAYLAGCPPIWASFALLCRRRTLRSSVHSNLVVPFAHSMTMQSHSFSVLVQ